MNIDLFDYYLPSELIAQNAAEPRDSSRLMVMNRKTKTVEHRRFYNIKDYLLPGDLLVVNNTRVIPARLFGEKETGARIEIFLLNERAENTWETLCKPGKRIKPGSMVFFELEGKRVLSAKCTEIKADGNRVFLFESLTDETERELMFKIGNVPLPPYIHEELKETERYQTVYSSQTGAVAAPTAGLHFTPELLKELVEYGVDIAEITLHVGLGTFRPVDVDTVEEHQMHHEEYFVKKEIADKIFMAKKEGRRIIAVGTTSIRVLETIVDLNRDENGGFSGSTDIFIYPPYQFKMVDALITNFHLPKSTLLILLSAFADREFIMSAYQTAINEKYRFYSFGDACLIL